MFGIMMQAETLDEAVEIVNAEQHGNGTAIFTRSGPAAKQFQSDVNVSSHCQPPCRCCVLLAQAVHKPILLARMLPVVAVNPPEASGLSMHAAQVGMVGINVPIPVPLPFFSFTGWKNSFYGDLAMYGKSGVHFFTQQKTVTTNWKDLDDAPGKRVGLGMTSCHAQVLMRCPTAAVLLLCGLHRAARQRSGLCRRLVCSQAQWFDYMWDPFPVSALIVRFAECPAPPCSNTWHCQPLSATHSHFNITAHYPDFGGLLDTKVVRAGAWTGCSRLCLPQHQNVKECARWSVNCSTIQ